MTKDMIISFDVDGVCAELHTVWLNEYNRDYDDDLKMEDIKTWNIHAYCKPECGLKIYDYLTAEMYDLVRPVDGALECVRAARELGRVIFVTSSVEKTCGRKYWWLKEHGFIDDLKDYIECSDKGLVRANILVDDYEENLYKFTGRKILVAYPWNADAQAKAKMQGINVASSTNTVLEILEELCGN